MNKEFKENPQFNPPITPKKGKQPSNDISPTRKPLICLRNISQEEKSFSMLASSKTNSKNLGNDSERLSFYFSNNASETTEKQQSLSVKYENSLQSLKKNSSFLRKPENSSQNHENSFLNNENSYENSFRSKENSSRNHECNPKLEEKIQKVIEENTFLNNQLQEKCSFIINLQNQLSLKCNDELIQNNLETSLQNQIIVSQTLEKNILDLKNQLKMYQKGQQEATDIQSKYNSLLYQSQQNNEIIEQLQEKLAQLKQETINFHQEKYQNQQLNFEKKQLLKDLELKSEKIKSLCLQNQKLSQKYKQIEQEQEEIQQKNEQLIQQLTAKESEFLIFEQKLTTECEEEMRNIVQPLVTEKNNFQNLYQDIQCELEITKETLRSFQNKFSKSCGEINELKTQLDGLKRNNLAQNKSLIAVENDLYLKSSEIVTLREKIHQLENQTSDNSHFSSILIEKQQQICILNEQNVQKDYKIQELQNTLDQIKLELSEKNALLLKVQTENFQMNNSLTSLQELLKKSKFESERLYEMITDLQKELEKYQKTNECQNLDLMKLKNQNQSLQFQLNSTLSQKTTSELGSQMSKINDLEAKFISTKTSSIYYTTSKRNF